MPRLSALKEGGPPVTPPPAAPLVSPVYAGLEVKKSP